MKNRLFKAFYKIHIYVGIFVALHFAVLAISGAVLLFKDEIEGVSTSELVHHQGPLLVDNFFQHVLNKYPGERPLAMSLEETHPDVVQFRLGKDGAKEFRGSRRVYVDMKSGEEIARPHQQSSFMDWLLRLHREFLLGSYGKIYVGLIGLLYVFVLLSGLFIYGGFSKKTSFGEIRRQSTRAMSADLHRFLGIATLAWGLAIGGTGMFLGLSTTLINVFQYSELKKLNELYPSAPTGARASLDKVLASAQAALPESTFDYLAFPDTQFAPPGHFLVLMHGNTLWTERLVELVVVDAVTGDLTEVRELPWYLKFGMLSEPLHFGNYGGLGLKILWLVFTLVSLSLPVLGIVVWYQRRFRPNAARLALPNLQPWTAKIFRNTWVLPGLMAVFTLGGILGSFLSEGTSTKIWSLLLLVPLFFCLRVLNKIGGKKS